jgi:hypothetical protein
MKTKILFSSVLIALLIIFAGCKKKEENIPRRCVMVEKISEKQYAEDLALKADTVLKSSSDFIIQFVPKRVVSTSDIVAICKFQSQMGYLDLKPLSRQHELSIASVCDDGSHLGVFDYEDLCISYGPGEIFIVNPSPKYIVRYWNNYSNSILIGQNNKAWKK